MKKSIDVFEQKKILDILKSCSHIRIGIYSDGEVYIVPLNFGFSSDESIDNGKISIYMHSNRDGKKIELIKNSPKIGFETDCSYSLNDGEVACSIKSGYKSVIGRGSAVFIEDLDKKREALALIMKQSSQASHGEWELSDAMLKTADIIRIDVDKISGKIIEED